MITIVRIFGLASGLLLGLCILAAALVAGGNLVNDLITATGFPYPNQATAVIMVAPFALAVSTVLVKTERPGA